MPLSLCPSLQGVLSRRDCSVALSHSRFRCRRPQSSTPAWPPLRLRTFGAAQLTNDGSSGTQPMGDATARMNPCLRSDGLAGRRLETHPTFSSCLTLPDSRPIEVIQRSPISTTRPPQKPHSELQHARVTGARERPLASRRWPVRRCTSPAAGQSVSSLSRLCTRCPLAGALLLAGSMLLDRLVSNRAEACLPELQPC